MAEVISNAEKRQDAASTGLAKVEAASCRFSCARILVIACLLTFFSTAAALPFPRRSGEYRSINTDRFEVSLKKSGRADVRLISGEPVFRDAHSMVWFEGEESPAVMDFDGRQSARTGVENRLGQGQGILLRRQNGEWTIQTYVNQPFLTAQVVFTNTCKRPVKIRALSPWCVSGRNSLLLAPSSADAVVLENGGPVYTDDEVPRLVQGQASSLWNTAVYSPASQRSVVLGALTSNRAYTQVRIERGEDKDFRTVQVQCVYDPPVEVSPGERLRSEWIYVAVAERNPLEGIERYGHAVAVANGLSPRRPLLPHGWDSWNTAHHTNITEQKLLAELDVMDRHLKRYGWTHFAVDDGWQLARGHWEPNPDKFPHGMKWLADQIHARGMTAGIWIDPFTVNITTPVAKAHPEWLVAPNAEGRDLFAEDERILDVTAPGAYEYIRSLMAKIGGEWGYDALMEADFTYRLLFAESYHDNTLTRIEVLRKGMQALREGFGSDRFIMGLPPQLVTGLFTDGMRLGEDCAPLWRKRPDDWPWGCVESLTNAARRYYLAPYLWTPDQDCAYFGHEDTRIRWNVGQAPALTWNQSVAWLTGAALTGGVVKIGDAFTSLSEQELAALKKLLPVPDAPARPVDFFERECPCIWSLPMKTPAGEWHILALFNWREKEPQTRSVEFKRLGLDPDAYYTVYDFWQDVYHGTARAQIQVAVAPGSVTLLGLRRYTDRPMFLSTDRHFTQGATDHTSIVWDESARELHGAFNGIENTNYNLRVLVPDPYKPATVAVSTGPAQTSMDGRVLKIGFRGAHAGPVEWRVTF